MRAPHLLLIAACAHRAPPRPSPPRAPAPAPTWPVAVKVMTWTSDGIIQVGELPDHPPPNSITTPWFVEPIRELDEPTFAKLILALRSEHVPGLSLRSQPTLPLGELRDLPDLTALVLDDTPTDDAALAMLHLALTRIYLQRTAIDDSAVTALALREPQLEVLDLEGCTIGDASVSAIAKLTELRALDLAGTRITDSGGAQLGVLAKLQTLDLGKTRIAARTIAAIRPLALRELFIPQTFVGKEIVTLGGFAPGLVRFDASTLASEYKPTDADLGWLANARNLVEIGLANAKVHDKLVIAIAALPELREVRLDTTPITLAAIKELALRTELREVDLADTPVDDASARAFLAFPELRMLRLDGTPVGDHGLDAVPGAELGELYLSSTKVTDAGLKVLDRLPHLVALGLGATKIGDATIERIAKLAELRTLVLAKTRTEKLELLGRLASLERLYLEDTWLNDDQFAAYAPLKKLRVLHANVTNISDDSLEVLRGMRQLEELTIGDTRMTKALFEIDAWPRLRTLSLVGLLLGDADLPALAKLISIQALDLTATLVTDPAPLVVLPALRVLGLAETKPSKAGLASIKQLAAHGIEIKR